MTTPTHEPTELEALAALILATREFAAVLIGRTNPTAEQLPCAQLLAGGWEDRDDTDPALLLHRVNFTVRIIARDEDPQVRARRLAILAHEARFAVYGADLGRNTLPALTRISRANPDPTERHPNEAVTLYGEFTTLDPPDRDDPPGDPS